MAISQALHESLARLEETEDVADFVAALRQMDTDAAGRHAEILSAISDLRAYVERIETEANDMMKGMTDPGELLKRFMG